MGQLLDLDRKVFPEFHQIDLETTKTRLQINSQTDIAVFDGITLMGYISLYPIPGCIFNDIKTGLFNEHKVEQNTLPYKEIGVYDSYLCGIAIDKELYPRFKSRFLIEQLQKHLLKLKKRGVFIRRIIAHAVSIAGRKTLQKMNFKEVKPNIFMYNCFKQGFLFLKNKCLLHPSLDVPQRQIVLNRPNNRFNVWDGDP
ncbi:hypothetical protein NDS46_30010 (plasmid) [Paenibacillus thiaminolyticus]|uniref:hypothetical protein n=1 Tax=Paenibacillus thiaminolyticus TaxID=49283 RepID=UPI00232E02C3|nr:hypothetical protein [Paenibacillus thiaminolyticus]WCF11584.1 hypothetical protein NDS46_30010 [Paenibacillus thiaminolyticus]